MKVVIEVDLTPAEARELMGLPDMQPLQKAAMESIRERVIAQAKDLSPAGLVQTWFSGEGVRPFGDMLGSFLSLARPREKDTAAHKGETER